MRKLLTTLAIVGLATSPVTVTPAFAYSTWTSPTTGVTFCKSRQKHTGAFTKKFGGILYWLWPEGDGC